MNQSFIVATIKPWNIANYHHLKTKFSQYHWHLITSKADLIPRKIAPIKPRYIFIPHWSWIIPKSIWANYECVVFHMTDLPYGRGGTPLQNLILRHHKTTKISAIKVDQGLDTGPIYFKRNLSLTGNATQIYARMSRIVFNFMIPKFLNQHLVPKPQQGKPIAFKRRQPHQSQIPRQADISLAYDYIRMLDAPEYPKAFLETSKLRLVFSDVKKNKHRLTTQVEIYEK